ncbi:hypothetical protein HD806DRAFT_545344 [Xylariaceae sp. AK1471]|nr:hypothetical protein HD806DRAFT_545344 [Xylariaceae sp. AK1471]
MERGTKESTPDPSEPGEVVTICIPSGEKYYVHSPILAYVSEYFRRGLSGQMIEAKTRTFNLTEHATPATVSLFVRWAYARSNNKCVKGGTWAPNPIPTTGVLIDTWLLGDYLSCPDFVGRIEEIMKQDATLFSIYDLSIRWAKVNNFDSFRDTLVKLACQDLKNSPLDSRRTAIKNLPRMALEEISLCLIRQGGTSVGCAPKRLRAGRK